MAEQDETESITELEQQLFIAESVIGEYRQALADAQFALATANAQLKLTNQPTA
ncbi:hypothetical protein ABZ820_33555 [Streptomyces diacarni]|uniref:hypothetical protein n=1 Tax=Streptomyces diacarni TaxID=2800381 RepID=UPI0033E372AE